jgi:AcrR family transcriptional regulator
VNRVETSVSDRAETSEVARHMARVAARLFATRGYDATSVREIVEAAGVTKPTLYYHFGSKEGLAQALLTVPMTRLVEGYKGIMAGPGDPVAKLEQTFEIHFALCRENPDGARFVYALLFGPHDSELAAELARFGEKLTGLTVEAVRPLAVAGRIAAGRVDDFALACRGMIVISTMDFLYRGGALELGLGHRLVGDLLNGFGGREGAVGGRE